MARAAHDETRIRSAVDDGGCSIVESIRPRARSRTASSSASGSAGCGGSAAAMAAYDQPSAAAAALASGGDAEKASADLTTALQQAHAKSGSYAQQKMREVYEELGLSPGQGGM